MCAIGYDAGDTLIDSHQLLAAVCPVRMSRIFSNSAFPVVAYQTTNSHHLEVDGVRHVGTLGSPSWSASSLRGKQPLTLSADERAEKSLQR
jgi:hypothetical protein